MKSRSQTTMEFVLENHIPQAHIRPALLPVSIVALLFILFRIHNFTYMLWTEERGSDRRLEKTA
jgi:hypothetical protein